MVIEEQEFAESKGDRGARNAMDDAAAAQYAGESGASSASDSLANAGFDAIDEELPFT